jgi:hypothetical protein
VPRVHKDLTGSAIGVLRVIERLPSNDRRHVIYKVMCNNCNRSKNMIADNIRRSAKSCQNGCWCKSSSYKNGATLHPCNKVWEGMMRRCYSDKHEAYHRYGGRGISVCETWRSDPFKFFAWLEKHGWHEGLQVDRIDNDGDYSPGNCRLVTSIVNNNNKSTNVRVSVNGIEMTVSEISRAYGILPSTIKYRIDRGYNPIVRLRAERRSV